MSSEDFQVNIHSKVRAETYSTEGRISSASAATTKMVEAEDNAPRLDAPEARNLLEGVNRKGIKLEKHPAWYPPAQDAATAAVHPLHILNSFTERVERFVPSAEASNKEKSQEQPPSQRKRVLWYTCGPTVYDVSHMGHARAYLTFDILRRVFEDYFNYDVVLQMNITDIDDKIIKRARIGKLLSDYRAANLSSDAIITDLETATKFTTKVLDDRAKKLAEPLATNAPSRVVQEREEKIKELALKREQHATTVENIEKAKAAAAKKKSGAGNELIDAGANFLGDWLDEVKGGTITENSIFDAHARKFEKMYFEDMTALNIKEPDVVTRVSEVVPQVVDFVKRIIERGYAYSADSSVFFDTQAYIKAGHDYPKLKPVADHLRTATLTTEDEMAEGEGSLSMGFTKNEKKSPNDFALWKFSKPGEPAWDSPWGKGRPGWHIECSVMASGVLGRSMDIHAGGCDLKFPHHDNELAQSEAYWGHSQWVNYFLHCGHLSIKGLKMSKSLKNFITIRQAMDPEGLLKVTSREMRLLFLMNDWHKGMNFSEQSVGEARQVERTLRSFFGSVDIILRVNWLQNEQTFSKIDSELLQALHDATDTVHASLCNNIDTVTSMDALMSLVAAGNRYLKLTSFTSSESATSASGSSSSVKVEARNQAPSATLLKKVSIYITKILRVFGVVSTNDNMGFSAEGAGGATSEADDNRLNIAMDALIALRDEVRKANREKQMAGAVMPMCDKVRDELLTPAGIRLEDKPGSGVTTWKKDDPVVLMRERAQKIAEAAARAIEKIGNKLETQKKLVSSWKKKAVDPAQMFRLDSAYSKFDEATGLPTHDNKGAELDSKIVKKRKGEQDKQAKDYAEFVKKGGADWLATQEEEISVLEAALAEATQQQAANASS